MPVPDAAQLRAAGSEYPEWVQTQYLALRDDVPPRVLSLARDLTATAPTPYDRALAIENYLRTIPYTLDVPEPPANRDVVDYFLFDLRRGYCDYYATAMAVLARGAGLPARLAVGYGAGEYDARAGAFHVRQKDAHSWTQIYFPNYGWVDFEPTSGRAALARDSVDTLSGPTRSAPPVEATSVTANLIGALQRAWFIVPGMLILLGVSALLWGIGDTWRLMHMPPALALEQLYRRMRRAARQLGLEVLPSHTPSQVAAMLESYFAAAEFSRLASSWLPVRESIPLISEFYLQTAFGGRAVKKADSAALVRRWQSVAVRLWLAIVLRHLQRSVVRFTLRGTQDKYAHPTP
jgi:hypothetical protein